MRPDEPLACILLRESALNVLEVVVSGEVEWVATGHVVVYEGVVLDNSELLSRVKLLSRCVSIKVFVR
jgi:hypothetical protein